MYCRHCIGQRSKIQRCSKFFTLFTERKTILSARRPSPVIPGIDLLQEINIRKGVIKQKLDSNFYMDTETLIYAVFLSSITGGCTTAKSRKPTSIISQECRLLLTIRHHPMSVSYWVGLIKAREDCVVNLFAMIVFVVMVVLNCLAFCKREAAVELPKKLSLSQYKSFWRDYI